MADEQNLELYLSQERDFWGSLKLDLQELQGISRLIYELIQNADDVKKPDGSLGGATQISLDITDQALICENDGVFSDCGKIELPECPWKEARGHRCDFHRIKIVGGMDKRQEEDTTGAFGIGFNSVYQVTDHPEIISNGWHWILQPEKDQANRIYARRVGKTTGTRFFLPWAFDPQSAVRKELSGVPALQKGQINGFVSQIMGALPKAAIFLKQINQIELRHNGKVVTIIKRTLRHHQVELDIDGKISIWQKFNGDFSEEATMLKKRNNGVIEETRKSEISLAIPRKSIESGYLYAYLPTEMKCRLPFHIQADFYPTANRKNILLDDSVRSQWNRLAIKSTANLLISVFDEVITLFDPLTLWDWIAAIYQGSKENPIDSSLSIFWDLLKDVIIEKEIMVTSTKNLVYPKGARLLSSDEERNAERQFEGLGIHLVHSSLRKYYGMLREIGVPVLAIKDVIDACEQIGLTESTSLEQLPKSLASENGLEVFWQAMNQVWERTSVNESNNIKEQLASCSLALGKDGKVHPPGILSQSDTETRILFSQVAWYKPLGHDTPVPSQLIKQFTIDQGLDYLESIGHEELNKKWSHGQLSLIALYDWFEKHSDQIRLDGSLKNRLRRITIWPAGGKLRTLEGLYLPGGFEDPLGLATVVDVTSLGRKSEFLRDVLGVRLLDLKTYICDQLPRALSHDDLVVNTRIKLVKLLSERLGEFRDDLEVKNILKSLPLVECIDGNFHIPEEVYFDNENTRVLGNKLLFVKYPSINQTAVAELYKWLGVAESPRYPDIISKVEELSAQKPTDISKYQVEKIFLFLGEKWNSLEQSQSWEKKEFEKTFDYLKRKMWLPGSRKKDQWFSPDTLYSRPNEYLFFSQGNFLDFNVSNQNKVSKFINFLVINNEPKPIQIVRHILFCSQQNLPVNKEVYRYLNFDRYLQDREALSELNGQKCILQNEDPVQYVRPDQVFWGDHPFGKYRYKLGEGNRGYENLFNFLGVKQSPEISDYVQVLLDIANLQQNKILDEESNSVIMSCWKKLSEALQNEEIEKDEIRSKLCNQRVIPDPRGVLTNPDSIFFEDRAGLVDHFPILKNSVIQRTEGCWLAMEVAGVRLMSQLIGKDPAEEIDSIPDEVLANLINERKTLIQRIIDAEKTSGVEIFNADHLLSLDYRRTDHLVIKMTFKGYRRPLSSDPQFMDAVIIDDAFYTVWNNGTPNWAAVGREIALGIKPNGEIGSLAMGIKEVLSSSTYEIAQKSLDELSFPPLKGYKVLELSTPEEIDLTSEQALTAILGGVQPPQGGPIPPGFEGEGIAQFTPKTSGDSPKPPRRRTSHIITYVYPDDDLISEGASSSRDTTTEKAGIKLVKEYEHKNGRTVRDMNEVQTNFPGYDLESTDPETGMIRYIEVKSLSGDWEGPNPAKMSRNEFNTAKQKGPEYWLYIVERAKSEDFNIYKIQDPANRANYFGYDHGWIGLSID